MGDILASIAKWFKERTTSPLYGTFVFSVILFNWKFFYILFWQDEDKLSLPKIEYVQRNILDYQSLSTHITHFLIFPIIITYLIVWWLPILSNWAHKKHTIFYYKRRLIIDSARLDYEKEEKNNLKSLSEVKKEQAVVKKEIQKNTSEEERWAGELHGITSLPKMIEAIKVAVRVVYEAAGRFTTDYSYNGNYLVYISPDHLARLDTLGIINIIKGDGNSDKINLTEKGKFFVKKLQNEWIV